MDNSIIETPKYREHVLRSVAGIANHNGLFFIARRKRDNSEMSQRWEFPGGKVERGETDEQALEREFLEEFGVQIQILRFLGESAFLHRDRSRGLAAWEILFEPTKIVAFHEHSEAAWIPFEHLWNLELADSDRGLLPLIKVSLHIER
jgi:mutator protein MutT